jgi:1-deoxy-D-xylulose-5-phosphate synthase
MAPKDEQELRNMLYTAATLKKGPIALRYPRGNGIGVPLGPFSALPIGKGETLRTGSDIALLAIGSTVNSALKAADLMAKEGVSCEVVNARFVKPLDTELLDSLGKRFKKIITLEENSILGGFGSAVAEFYAVQGVNTIQLKLHGLPDRFVDHGSPAELAAEVLLDPQGIAQVVREFVGDRTPAAPKSS